MKFLRWQISGRLLQRKVIVPWVDDAKFVIGIGDMGMTLNYYFGLGEFEDMLFLMHALQSDEIFVDIGANLGSFTILASSVVKANSICFEPVPETVTRLEKQIRINGIAQRVQIQNKGVADKNGTLVFSANSDTTNKVLDGTGREGSIQVDVVAIDQVLASDKDYFFKIDVEGYEHFVLEGAKSTLSSARARAVIIEINGSAEEFGYSNPAIHDAICALGFYPVSYDPFTRTLVRIPSYNPNGGNTIYVKDIEVMAARCKSAPRRIIHTANGIAI